MKKGVWELLRVDQGRGVRSRWSCGGLEGEGTFGLQSFNKKTSASSTQLVPWKVHFDLF